MKWYIRFVFGLAVCLAGITGVSCRHDGGGVFIPPEEPDVSAVIDAGHNSLDAGDYDKAIEHYQAAYEANKNDPEAITYSVLAELAAISIDPKVKDLLQNRLGVVNYPDTMGALFTTDWMGEYTDGNFTEFLPGLTVPAWFESTEVYKESLTGGVLKSTATFPLLLAANLLDKNTGGLNDLFDDILDSVFGGKFEAIAARLSNLGPDAVITLDAEVTAALGLDELLEGSVNIGKPELDVLIAGIRIVKASFEWIASYDWDSDLNLLKFDWTDLDEFKAKLSAASVNDLPFRNDFLNGQDQAALYAAKADYLAALAAISGAYDAIGGRDYIPQGVKTK